MSESMTQYVIYDHPDDEPDAYVVRRWFIPLTPGSSEPYPEPEIWLKSTSLNECRASIPRDMTRLPRSPLDDPKIVEVWL